MEITIVGLWRKLEALYLSKCIASQLVLKKRLCTLHMVEETSIKSDLNEFFSLINDLKIVDVKLEDQDQVILLLCLLPPFYKNFKETMIYERTSLTFDDIVY